MGHFHGSWLTGVILACAITPRLVVGQGYPATGHASADSSGLEQDVGKFDVLTYADSLPVVLSRVEPLYPDSARVHGVTGTVVVEVVVGKDGRVHGTKVVKSIPPLDGAAVAAVRKWAFRPAIDDKGKPVAVWIPVSVEFPPLAPPARPVKPFSEPYHVGSAQTAPRDSTVSEPAMGYAFEVPRGCIVVPGVDGRGARNPGWFQIDNKGGEPLVMVRTYGPGIFRALLGDAPLSDPGDTLLSYARAEAWQLVAGEGTPDSIVTLRRYRSAAGQEVFEALVKFTPGVDCCDEDDTTSAVPSPRQTEDTAQARVCGPMFVVSLSRPGAHLLLIVTPWGCYEGLPMDAERVGRVISQTARWR